MKHHILLLSGLIACLTVFSHDLTLAQGDTNRPVFQGVVTFPNGNPAPNATRVQAVKGTCVAGPVNVCSPPQCPVSGWYAIGTREVSQCGPGTYTLKAEYNDGVSTLHWGYTTGVWDGTNDPVRVDIVLDHAENY